jgi:hypothetical protein
MKAVVRNANRPFITYYETHQDSNGTFVTEVFGMEMELLKLVLEQMNMTFIHVPTPKGFELPNRITGNLFRDMFEKRAYIALGQVGMHYLLFPFLDSTNSHSMLRFRWYVPCSVKYPRWSSMFRILSVEVWLVLIISIVIAAILTTLVGRYSYTSELQRYKTLTSSLTNIWGVILGVAVSAMPRAPSLRSLFLAWVCFSLAFSTMFQAFLITFLIDSGYKTPIQNMDELFASGIKLVYVSDYRFLFEIGDETEVSKVQRNLANCPSYEVCYDWARYYKNASILLSDLDAEVKYSLGNILGDNSKPLLCGLEDGLFYNDGLRMVMFHGDPLMRRVTEIIDRVVEAGIYNFWKSLLMNSAKISSHKISLVHPLDGYHSFNLYHMQTAFYLLLMGWCISALCFLVEVFYNRLLSKRK